METFWTVLESPTAEIEADLKSAAPDLPIGRATDGRWRSTAARGRVGQKARCCARRVGTQMAEIEANLKSAAPDLPIGRATDGRWRSTGALGRVEKRSRTSDSA